MNIVADYRPLAGPMGSAGPRPWARSTRCSRPSVRRVAKHEEVRTASFGKFATKALVGPPRRNP